MVLWKKPHQQKYPISQISYFCICNLCWSSLYCLFSTTTRRGHNCQFWKNVVMLESKWKRDRFRHLQFLQTICKICSWFWFLTNQGILARISHTTWKVHKGKYIKESGPPDLHKKYITSTCNELLRFDFCKVVKCVTFMSCYRINRFHFQFSKKWQSSRIAKIIIAICNLLSSAKLIVFLLVINSSLRKLDSAQQHVLCWKLLHWVLMKFQSKAVIELPKT